MDSKPNDGYIYYFHSENTDDKNNYFSSISTLNSISEKINTIKIYSNKIISISSKNQILQWEQDKDKDKDKDINLILGEKPTYLFPKIKFKSISLSKSVTLGLDINGNVLVWGQSSEGVLGLGFDISKVENPTILEDLKNIIQISSSDHHAIAVNSEGVAYSWGTGKYGELGLERSIYSSVPQQIPTDTCYSKVFCSNLISCFLDFEGHFHYFGVVIKQLSGNGSTLTIKSLLEEQIYNDGKVLFLEKQIEELENEKFKNILIGNGFIALLSFDGKIYILEYNDKLTKLYTKYSLDNISLSDDNIFGFAKEEKNNINNHYLLRWKCHYSTENDLYSDCWSTTIWKFIDNNNILDNCELVGLNSNKNLIFLKLISQKENKENKEELVHLSNSGDNMEKSINLELAENQNQNNDDIMKDIKLEFESEFDDSYNLKYKRNQLNTLLNDISMKNSILNNINNYNSFYALGKNRSLALNYNQNANKTVLFQNKMNSPLIINNSRNIFERTGINSGNKNNTLKSNFIYNSNGEFLSKTNNNNKNDLNDNVNIYEIDDNNNKSKIIKKNRNASEDCNFNSDESDFVKNELNKYRSEVDNIINNFKQKKQSKSFSMLGKNKKNVNNNVNNIRLIDNNKEDYTSNDNSNNDLTKGYNISKSISNIIKNNENSNPVNEYNSRGKKRKKISNNNEDFFKGFEEEQEKNNLKNKSKKTRNREILSPICKKIFRDKKIKNIAEYLSLIEEENESSFNGLKRKRTFDFSKKDKKSTLKNKINKVKNLKNKFYNINQSNEEPENIIDSKNEDIIKKSKINYSDLDLFDLDIINKKEEEQNEEIEENDSKENTNSKIILKKGNIKDKNKNSNIRNNKKIQENEKEKFNGENNKNLKRKYNFNIENDVNKDDDKNDINKTNGKIHKTKSKRKNNINDDNGNNNDNDENEEIEEIEKGYDENNQNINNKIKKKKNIKTNKKANLSFNEDNDKELSNEINQENSNNKNIPSNRKSKIKSQSPNEKIDKKTKKNKFNKNGIKDDELNSENEEYEEEEDENSIDGNNNKKNNITKKRIKNRNNKTKINNRKENNSNSEKDEEIEEEEEYID